MSAKNKKTSLGIFFTDEYLYFAQLINVREEFVIDKLKMVPMPPRCLLNGKVKDGEALANQMVRAIGDEGLSLNQITIAFSDHTFLKHIDTIPLVPDFELKDALEEKIKNNYPFYNTEEYLFGYQKLPVDINKHHPDQIEVLFTIFDKSKVVSIKELFETMDITIYAMDIEPLSVIRAISNDVLIQQNNEIMTIYISSDFVDLNILLHGEVIFTNTIKKNMTKVFSNSMNVEELMQRIKNFIFSYENKYPRSDLKQVLVVSYLTILSDFMDALKEVIPKYEINIFDLVQSKSFKNMSKFSNDEILSQHFNEFIPCIGLALKSFEGYNKTLSLVRSKVQLEPIVRVFELAIALIVFISISVFFIGFSFYLQNRLNSIDDTILKTKEEIQIYSTGEYIQRQQKLQQIKAEIAYYNQYRAENIRAILLNRIISELPEDISFETLALDDKNVVVISGSCLLMSSLYQWFKYLTDICQDVEMMKLTNIFQSDSGNIKFQIRFQWGQPTKS